jgi:signal transduction histidine kinase
VRLYTATEFQQVERGLAVSRMLLSFGLLLWPESTTAVLGTPDAWWRGPATEQALVVLFAAYAAALLALNWYTFSHAWHSRVFLHALDALWAIAFWATAGVMTGPFGIVAAFAILAAGFRAGLYAAVVTTVAIVLPLLVYFAFVPVPGGALQGDEQSRVPFDTAAWFPQLLLMVLGLSYLVARQRRLLAESTVLSRLAAQIYEEQKPGRAVNLVSAEMLRISGARRVIFIGEDEETGRALVSDVREGAETGIMPRLADDAERPSYLFPMDADCWHLVRLPWPRDRVDLIALDAQGRRARDALCDASDLFQCWPVMESMAVFSLGRGEGWHGRFLLVDPRLDASRLRDVRFLQRLVHVVAPVIREKYRLHRVRSLAKTRERSRLASELHDGVIQSLMAAEMQVDALRKSASRRRGRDVPELARVQQLLHEEALGLRDVMRRLRPIEITPDELLPALRDLLGRFARDTGIAASLRAEIDQVNLTPRTCATVVRIVQEALTNVRKHSGARSVTLALVPDAGTMQLFIEDDGHGFPPVAADDVTADAAPSGRLPRLTVIEECVRVIDGKLSVEFAPPHGLRLRIQIPTLAHPSWNRLHNDTLGVDVSYALARWVTAAAAVTAGSLQALRRWTLPITLDWPSRVADRTK